MTVSGDGNTQVNVMGGDSSYAESTGPLPIPPHSCVKTPAKVS